MGAMNSTNLMEALAHLGNASDMLQRSYEFLIEDADERDVEVDLERSWEEVVLALRSIAYTVIDWEEYTREKST